RVDARLLRDGERPHLLGERERQRQRRQERLASRKRADAPSLLAVPRVDDEELVALEREPVAAGGERRQTVRARRGEELERLRLQEGNHAIRAELLRERVEP